MPIVPKNFLKPVAQFLEILAVVAAGSYFIHKINYYSDCIDKALGYSVNKNDDLIGKCDGNWLEFLDKDDSYLAWIGIIFIIIALFMFFIWIISLILNLALYIIGPPLSKAINKVVWTSVRQRAWGDDLLKEDVKAIGSHPPEFPEQFGPLPDAVSEPLRGHSEKHAILTLHKVRMILGMAQDAKPSADIKSELSESLKWQELIHTSYFDVPEFVDLLALRLHRAGLGDLKQGFTLDGAARDALDAWCDGKAA
jgi:hypothetical protein